MSLKVELYRYDLTNGMAAQFAPVLIGRPLEGVWHTAIVLNVTEYYFDGGVGIEKGRAGQTRFGMPKRLEALGYTNRTVAEFEQWNRHQMESNKFGPNSYNLMENNCNHYSQEACQFLLGKDIPEDVRTMIPTLLATPLGRMVAPMLQQMSAAPGAGAGGIGATPFGAGLGGMGMGGMPMGGMGGFGPMGDALMANLANMGAGMNMGMGMGMGGGFNTAAAAPHPAASASTLAPSIALDADAQESLDIYLALIASDDASSEAKKTTLDALERIFTNIRNQPANPHYQRLSVTSEFYKNKIVQPFENASELLLLAGFEADGDTHLAYKGDVGTLEAFVTAIQKTKATL